MKKDVSYSEYGAHKNIQDVIQSFAYVDRLMSDFFELMEKSDVEVEYEIKGTKNIVEPFKLFTHVITHEYHHKGQILSLSRHLGYIPVDTDIIR